MQPVRSWRAKKPTNAEPAAPQLPYVGRFVPSPSPYVSREARLGLGLFGPENLPMSLRPDGAPDERKDRVFDDEL